MPKKYQQSMIWFRVDIRRFAAWGCSKSWRNWTRTTMTSLAKMSSGLSQCHVKLWMGAPTKWLPKLFYSKYNEYLSCNMLYVSMCDMCIWYGYNGFIDKLTTERPMMNMSGIPWKLAFRSKKDVQNHCRTIETTIETGWWLMMVNTWVMKPWLMMVNDG